MMKKASAANIAGFLNRTLQVRKIRDSSANGLQVRSDSTGIIKKVGFAVDACLSTFEKAKKLKVGFLVVHHGIKWRKQKNRDLAKQRTAYLIRNRMALYAAHLPLDLHRIYGNNMQLSRMLDVQHLRKFGRYHGIKIGYAGTFKQSVTINAIKEILNRKLRTKCRVFPFGRERIRSIGIISGGGGSLLLEACREKLDCFLVGEIDLTVHNTAKELGMNLIVAGHYATETVGVRSLMPLIRDTFGVETVFVDDPKEL